MSQAGVEAAHVLVRDVLVLLGELDDHHWTQDSAAAGRRVKDVVSHMGSSSTSSLIRVSTSRPTPAGSPSVQRSCGAQAGRVVDA